jgi:hypothetical protein
MLEREETLNAVEAAFAHEPRLDVQRYPVHMAAASPRHQVERGRRSGAGAE